MFLLDSTCDICRCADGNKPSTSDISEVLIINKLENSCSEVIKWLRENHLQANHLSKLILMIAILIAAMKKNCSG